MTTVKGMDLMLCYRHVKNKITKMYSNYAQSCMLVQRYLGVLWHKEQKSFLWAEKH